MKRALIILVLLAVLAFSWAFDPVDGPAFYPQCPVKWLTGLDCPGCGSARALHALLHGELGAAFRFNPWLPVVCLVALLAFIGAVRPGRLRRFIHSPFTLVIFVALSLGWMLVRNLIS